MNLYKIFICSLGVIYFTVPLSIKLDSGDYLFVILLIFRARWQLDWTQYQVALKFLDILWYHVANDFWYVSHCMHIVVTDISEYIFECLYHSTIACRWSQIKWFPNILLYACMYMYKTGRGMVSWLKLKVLQKHTRSAWFFVNV